MDQIEDRARLLWEDYTWTYVVRGAGTAGQQWLMLMMVMMMNVDEKNEKC